jgi:predicted dehydrogenase
MSEPLRVGIIGYDTSHAPAFTRVLNDTAHPFHVPGARVVAGYPSYSEDVEASRSRVAGFRQEMAGLGVAEVGSIGALLGLVDAVLLESVDGRRHLAEVEPVLRAAKPVFVDKPLAAGYGDALAIARLVRETQGRIFSSSSLRYDANLRAILDDPALGAIQGCDAFSPATLEPTNPGLFWYGIHAVEILYTYLGPGCVAVRCHGTEDADLVLAEWGDGRIGTVRGTRRGAHDYGATVFGERTLQATYSRQIPMYAQLLRQIVPFFQGRPAPVPLEETLESMAFMQAALVSAREGGRRVALAELG